MNQTLPPKEVLIFDQFSSSGLLLANSFLSNDYSVTLFIVVDLVDLSTYNLLKQWKKRLTIIDIKISCDDNYMSKISAKHYSQIILLNEFTDIGLLFKQDLEKEIELKVLSKKVNEYLLRFSKANKIPLYQPSYYHGTPEILNEIVEHIITDLTLQEKRTSINYLDLVLEVATDSVYVDNLVYALTSEMQIMENLPLSENLVTLRDIYKTILEEWGAEIEFCGRGINEKGVVVDFDESVLSQLGILTKNIRLGNTLVKINDKNYDLILKSLKNEVLRDTIIRSSNDSLLLIKRLTNSIMCK